MNKASYNINKYGKYNKSVQRLSYDINLKEDIVTPRQRYKARGQSYQLFSSLKGCFGMLCFSRLSSHCYHNTSIRFPIAAFPQPASTLCFTTCRTRQSSLRNDESAVASIYAVIRCVDDVPDPAKSTQRASSY